MDGSHDMGGVKGFGPVEAERNEPVFHAPWERRTFALTLAMATPGGWNLDMSRFAREDRPDDDYLGMSYYQIWLAGLERLMFERNLISRDEITAGHMLNPPLPCLPVLKAEAVIPMLRRGNPTVREARYDALFAIGDKVRTKNIHPPTHTRLPRYVRGHVGVIERIHGCHVFPDTNAHGNGENPHWLYNVKFDGRTLWGDRAQAGTSVSVDAWEPYLEGIS
jgi:nitrile hydratase beta subunit